MSKKEKLIVMDRMSVRCLQLQLQTDDMKKEERLGEALHEMKADITSVSGLTV